MRGYVKNISKHWAYAMKRSIRPGGEVPLDELYEQYGKRHGIESGEPFINWLTDIKLKDKETWTIIYDFESDHLIDQGKAKDVLDSATKKEDVLGKVINRTVTVEDIVFLPVRKAREVLPKVMDLNLLKYSLTEARQLADKDSLCRLIERRIKDLQIAR